MDSQGSKSYDSLSTVSSSFAPQGSKRLENSQRPPFIYHYPAKFKHISSIHPNDAPEATYAITQYGWRHLTILNKLEILFCAIFLFVPRLLLFISTIVVLNLVALVATLSLKIENPDKPDINGVRSWLRYPCLWCYRLAYVCLGVWWLDEVGDPAPAREAPISVCGPHRAMVDTAFFGAFPHTNVMSPVSTSEFGFLNTPMRLLCALLISRENMKSRRFVIEEMLRRVNNPQDGWYPIIIFPEGTCGNGSTFLYFKPGAFIPGVPVQPIYLDVKNCYTGDTISFTWIDGINFAVPNNLWALLGCLLSLRIKMTVHYLPVYTPTEEEKQDPYLYAYNVRETMSNYANIPVVDTAWEDGKIMTHCSVKYGIHMPYAFPEANRLFKTYSVRLRELKLVVDDYCKKFKHVMDPKTGVCKIEDYAHVLRLDPDALRQEFFHEIQGFDGHHITIRIAAEGVLRAKENVSTSVIMSLDWRKIRELAGAKELKLSLEQPMFDFLQVNPQYTLVRYDGDSTRSS